MKGTITIHIDIPDGTMEKMKAAIDANLTTTTIYNAQQFFKTKGKKGLLPTMNVINKMKWGLTFKEAK